jgi:VWFA-related protein
LRRLILLILSAILLSFASAGPRAQTPTPLPSPTPAAEEKPEGQDPVKVFTEEVRLPVAATDSYGHYDPTVVIDDVLILEDGEQQQIRSVRHIPGNILFILDTGGGDLYGLGGMSKKTSITRDVALRIISRLAKGDLVAVMQSSDRADVLQPWTDDMTQAAKVLKSKLFAGKRSRIFESMAKAAQLLADRPEGSRHVILITDGVETPGGRVALGDAIKKLTEARATVHILSYTTFVLQKDPNKSPDVTFGQRPASENPITANDPTLPPGSTRTPSFGVSVRFDPAMKKLRKAYEAEVARSEKWLTDLANETGGRIFLPKAGEEMIAKGEEIAREIGAQYIVTYRPRKPLAEAAPGEYRRVEVASRRVGLYLRTRRGYFVPQSPQ